MPRGCFVFGAATATVLSVAPISDLLVWLSLLLAAELAVGMMLAEEWRSKPEAVVVAATDEPPSPLMRRIVPHLRSHRPQPVVEAQLAWRRAAEARRHLRRAS